MAVATAPARRPAGRPTPRPAPRRPPLRVFEPEKKRPFRFRRTGRHQLWLSVGMIVTSLLAVVVGDAFVTQSQVRLAHLQVEVDAATATQKALATTVAQLAAPTRVVARGIQLGLTAPAQVVDLPQVPLNVALPEPVIAATAPSPSHAAASTPTPVPAPTKGTPVSAAAGPATTAPPSSAAGAAGVPSSHAAAPATSTTAHVGATAPPASAPTSAPTSATAGH
jgi:hypothetical protein